MARERLIALRKAKLLTQEDVAHRTGRHRTSISDYETGATTPGVNTCRALAKLYDVSFEDLWDALSSNGENPELPDLIPEWLSVYQSMEQTASEVLAYGPHVLHALTQTEDYARAVVRTGEVAGHDSIDHLVDMRMSRQATLRREDRPMDFRLLLAETALVTQVGDAAVMAAQLEHLASLADLPNVTLHVLTFASGPHPATRGEFTILSFRHGRQTVYLEPYIGGASYVESQSEIDTFTSLWNRLQQQAASPQESVDLIRRRAREFQP